MSSAALAAAAAAAQQAAAPPPPGVQSNFNATAQVAPIFFAIGGFLLFFMIVLICTRAYAKIWVIRKATLDDLTSTVAAFGVIYDFIAVCFSTTRGKIGVHIWDIQLEHLGSKDFLLSTYMVDAWPTLIFLLIRISFILLYLEIFGPMPSMRYSCYTLLVLMTGFYIPYWIAQVYYTTPRPGETWIEDFQDPKFLKTVNLALPLASVSLVFDIAIFTLPIVGVSRLQMSRRRKFEVSLVFMTGLIAIIASTLSVVYRVKQQNTPEDYTYVAFPVQVTSFVEMSAGLAVFCMPTVSLLLRRHVHRNKQTGTTTTAKPLLSKRTGFSGFSGLSGFTSRHTFGTSKTSRTYQDIEADGSATHLGIPKTINIELGDRNTTEVDVRGGGLRPNDAKNEEGIVQTTTLAQSG